VNLTDIKVVHLSSGDRDDSIQFHIFPNAAPATLALFTPNIRVDSRTEVDISHPSSGENFESIWSARSLACHIEHAFNKVHFADGRDLATRRAKNSIYSWACIWVLHA
jgi:hypothetical protein